MLTSPFQRTIDRHLRHWRTEDEFPSIVLGHPIQNVPEQELDRLAEQLVRAVLEMLPPSKR